MYNKGEKRAYHDMSIGEIVSDIKGIQIVLKKLVAHSQMPLEHDAGKYDKKKVFEIDQSEESNSNSDDFSYPEKSITEGSSALLVKDT